MYVYIYIYTTRDFNNTNGGRYPETSRRRQNGHYPDESRRRRNASQPFSSQRRSKSPAKAISQGNRGEPSLQWRTGLRESTKSFAGKQRNLVSLFVDNIPQGIATSWLRNLFKRSGEVVDIFISAKIRKNKNRAFGFVRYRTLQEAQAAINDINGLAVQGKKLLVHLAKFEKDGDPVSKSLVPVRKKENVLSNISNPAYRDHRSYHEVVLGLKKKLEVMENSVRTNKNVIPVTFSLNVEENSKVDSFLKTGVIAENRELPILTQISSRIEHCHANVTGIYSLSPTKLLITFENENDANIAVKDDSPLWNEFDDVRLWSEGESFDDRLVWIECVGIHPLCWSKENLKLIGEKWGDVVHIVSDVQGFDSLTSARILVRTKAQNRIENRIKIFSERCSCDVWVKELYGNSGTSGIHVKEGNKTPTPTQIHDNLDEQLTKTGNNSYPLCFDDPLVQEMNDKLTLREKLIWVDPLIGNENIDWKLDAILTAAQSLCSPLPTPMSNSKPSRSRGRPRKSAHPQIPPEIPPHETLETRKTWELAQLLGISAHDEELVLSGLRKSKRIMLLEGNAA